MKKIVAVAILSTIATTSFAATEKNAREWEKSVDGSTIYSILHADIVTAGRVSWKFAKAAERIQSCIVAAHVKEHMPYDDAIKESNEFVEKRIGMWTERLRNEMLNTDIMSRIFYKKKFVDPTYAVVDADVRAWCGG